MFKAGWNITGQVMEKRPLTSPTNKEWADYLIKVGVLGSAHEIMCSKEQFLSFEVDQVVDASGHFEFFKGLTKMRADMMTAHASTKKSA